MIRKSTFLLLLSLPFVLSGCERLFIKDDPADDPVTNFEVMWSTIDKKYSFFEYKNIDWDSIYHVYRPMITPDMPPHRLFNVLAEMLYELEDGHVNLVSFFDISRNWEWYLNSPENFDYSVLERNYLRDDYEITGPFRNRFFDSVGYIYYGSFSSGFSSGQLDYLMDKFKDTKGLIIDIRHNGGGSVLYTDSLANRFAPQEQVVLYEQYKDGPAHNDFTDLFPIYVMPRETDQYLKPVVVLMNRHSYSASTFFAGKMAALPNVILMGDTTGGGGGIPIDYELPNGWRFRFSASQTFTPDGLNIEGGVPPDIAVAMTQADIANGVDPILEAAIDHLK